MAQLRAKQAKQIRLPNLSNVINDYKKPIKRMCRKMMSHDAYGKPYEWTSEDFEMGAPLGRGSFGRVYLARERHSHYMVAMKVMFKKQLCEANVQREVMHEIEIQSRLKHPNILRLLTWFHDEKRIYLALEIASEGELFKHLRSAQRFEEPRAAKYIYQVADALNYCHLNNVIHRDVKPENILLTSTDEIKLADFGSAAHTPSNKRRTICGTLDYVAPEMMDGHSYDDSVDQWCLGILCYEFLVGKPPFDYHTTDNLQVNYPMHLSPGAKEVISGLLRRQHEERISLVEVMKHAWVKHGMAQRAAQLKQCMQNVAKNKSMRI